MDGRIERRLLRGADTHPNQADNADARAPHSRSDDEALLMVGISEDAPVPDVSHVFVLIA